MVVKTIRIHESRDYLAGVRAGGQALHDAGIVVLPTETVYGLAARIDDSAARQRLRSLRPTTGQPFTPHLPDAGSARDYLGDVSEMGHRLMKKLWPGPVGISFDVPADRQAEVAARFNVEVTDLYHDGRITLRCPDHPVALDVIEAARAPIVAVSGSGHPALRVSDLPADVLEKVDLVLDAGPTRYSRPSTLVHLNGNDWEIVRAGIYDERIIERMLQTTILFVCSGNTCRSPMAEALARNLIAHKLGIPDGQVEEKGITVVSAGSYAMPGSRATPEAVEAVRLLGADLSRHRSQPLSVELIHQADHIFTMGRSHHHATVSLVPGASAKVHNLDPDKDIEDPIGGDKTLYVNLAEKMKGLIAQRLKEVALV